MDDKMLAQMVVDLTKQPPTFRAKVSKIDANTIRVIRRNGQVALKNIPVSGVSISQIRVGDEVEISYTGNKPVAYLLRSL